MITDVAASIRSRLYNKAKKSGIEFQFSSCATPAKDSYIASAPVQYVIGLYSKAQLCLPFGWMNPTALLAISIYWRPPVSLTKCTCEKL